MMRGTHGVIASGFSGAFSPSSLFSGGEDGAWYDPSDISTLWQDTAGTSAVTASGQTVARIDDKSGNGRHLIQTSAAARPTYTDSGGLKYLDFDGGDWLYLNTAAANITEGGGTISAAAASDQAEALGGIMEEVIDDATDFKRLVLYFDTRSTPRRLANYAPDGTDRYVNLDAEIDGTAKVFIFSSDGSTGEGYINNTQHGSSITTTANFASNTKIMLGRQTAGPLYLDGKIYGAVILDRGLSTAERGNLNAWLADKAGI